MTFNYSFKRGESLSIFIRDVERKLIDEALSKTDGNQSQAADLLGIKRTTLIMKLRALNETSDE